jgi:predicted nucleic acid binding AN1-type Zn finger protein
VQDSCHLERKLAWPYIRLRCVANHLAVQQNPLRQQCSGCGGQICASLRMREPNTEWYMLCD